MNNFTIDTNVFVSALGKPDIYTKASQRFFQALGQKTKVIIPLTVVAEVIINLYKQDRQTKAVAMGYLENFNLIPLDIKTLNQLIDIIEPTILKTSDVIVALTAKLHQATLITWDKQLLSKTNTFCSTLTPSQFLKKQ